MSTESTHISFNVALLAGALAGLTVDTALFPLDTLKTRLQSSSGFIKAGGFRRVYSGIGPVILGSAPTSAVFFCVYEPTKTFLEQRYGSKHQSVHQMVAAGLGETVACTVRVPVEITKQRCQAVLQPPLSVVTDIVRHEGPRGMYRGFFSTVIREIPFAFLEMPMWEYFKVKLAQWQGHKTTAWQSGLCGALAGALAGGLTTPLDVAKTRIMLAKRGSVVAQGSIGEVIKFVYRQKGITGLFAGIVPRMLWISIGGAIFLGIYDKCVAVLTVTLETNS